MPVHDWSRVSAGTFHDFHCSWITHLKEALNGGLLPDRYYAQSEQRAGNVDPDVLALEVEGDLESEPEGTGGDSRLVAVAEHPPQCSLLMETSADLAVYAARRRTLTIRHASGDRIVALIEIASPTNHVGQPFRDIVDKVIAALEQRIHVLLVDLLRPRPRHPGGVHGGVWEALTEESFVSPADRPLTLASYRAADRVLAYVESQAIGQPLPDTSLFLMQGHYVNVPLEATYLQAWRGIPARWQRVLEAPASRP